MKELSFIGAHASCPKTPAMELLDYKTGSACLVVLYLTCQTHGQEDHQVVSSTWEHADCPPPLNGHGSSGFFIDIIFAGEAVSKTLFRHLGMALAVISNTVMGKPLLLSASFDGVLQAIAKICRGKSCAWAQVSSCCFASVRTFIAGQVVRNLATTYAATFGHTPNISSMDDQVFVRVCIRRT